MARSRRRLRHSVDARQLSIHYSLTTIHYPLRGLKSLAFKRVAITHYRSRICLGKVRNPMILKNHARSGLGSSFQFQVVDDTRSEIEMLKRLRNSKLETRNLKLTARSYNRCFA